MSAPLVILGAGAHARECAWLADEATQAASYSLVAFGITTDSGASRIGQTPVLRIESIVEKYPRAAYVCAIGDPAMRRIVADAATRLGMHPATLVHRDARVAASATLGTGVVIFAGCVVSVSAVLGDHVHMNFNATVSHDCVLGDFATLSPGVHIAGNVVLGAEVLLGTGSSVRNGRPGAPTRIGARAIVGAGACVVRDVADGQVVVGVPARPLIEPAERGFS